MRQVEYLSFLVFNIIAYINDFGGEFMAEKDRVNVKFDYYQVSVSNTKSKKGKKKTSEPFDLTKWMDIVQSKYDDDPANVTMAYFGERIRCDSTTIINPDNNPLAELHFTKLREKNSPAVGSIHLKDLKPVQLSGDEFIAEDVSCIFDPSNYVLMLQKNIYSLSRSSLVEYINYFWNIDREEDDYEYIELNPIFRKDSFKNGKKMANFKKLSFKTGNKNNGQASFNNPFQGDIGKVFKAMQQLKGLNIEVTITASQAKNKQLDHKEVIKIINEIEDQQNLFKSASVSGPISGTDKSTFIDLMNGKVQSILPFDVPKKHPLDANSVLTSMLAEYRPDGKNMKRVVESNMNITAVE